MHILQILFGFRIVSKVTASKLLHFSNGHIVGEHSLVRQWLEKLQTMARAGDLRKSYGGALDFEVARCISMLLREISEQHGILDRTHGNHGIRDHELWTNDACMFTLIDNEVRVIFQTAAGEGQWLSQEEFLRNARPFVGLTFIIISSLLLL